MVSKNPSGQTITQYNVLTGDVSNNVNNVAPSAASGIPVISQGASAQPVFGTAVVAGGGTGAVTLTGVLTGNGTSTVTANTVTQHGVLIGGATNAVSSLGVAASGTFLGGNTGADPSFQSLPASSISITGNSGGALTGNAFTFTGGTTGLTFAGAGSTETLGGDLVVANGGTGAVSFNINGPVISNTTTTGALASVTLLNQKFLVGNTSAAPTSKGFSVVLQVFTGAGTYTYTPTSGMLYCQIECLGGGGGGGGAANDSAHDLGAGGGGAGSYARKISSAAAIGSSQTVTIGAGGNGGVSGANNGSNGSDTSLGAICIGKGGSGGAFMKNDQTGTGIGGAGGVAGTGDFTPTGPQGGSGTFFSNQADTISYSGTGASSLFGGGGLALYSTGTGNNATNYGGGGGGACSYQAGNQAGGNGSAGVCIITEYVIA